MFKKIIIITFLLALPLTNPVQADSHVTTVSISPEEFQVTPGQTFTLEIRITPAEGIFGAQVGVKFDPSVFEGVGTLEKGDFLSGSGATTVAVVNKIDNTEGIAEYGETILKEGSASKPGTLASITFKVKEDATQGETYAFELINTLLTRVKEGTPQEVIPQVQNATATISTTSTITSKTSRAQATKASLSSQLQQRLQSAKADEKIPVIVTVQENNPTQHLLDLFNLVNKSGAEDIKELGIAEAMAFKATPGLIEEVAGLPYVKHIELDSKTTVQEATATPSTPGFQALTAMAALLSLLAYLQRKR